MSLELRAYVVGKPTTLAPVKELRSSHLLQARPKAVEGKQQSEAVIATTLARSTLDGVVAVCVCDAQARLRRFHLRRGIILLRFFWPGIAIGR